MRVAILSDVHGNPITLDAVLADVAARGGADSYLVLGDLVAIGHDPIGVLERLTALPNARFVQGNTDRYVVTGQRPYPTFADAAADSSLIPRLVEVAHSFAWTQGMVTAAGWFDWLAALTLEQRVQLPDGTRLLATHVAPGYDDGTGIHPNLTDQELTALVADASAELICVGHTHWPVDRRVAGVRVINVGSVSNPVAFDLRASYALLDATDAGYQVELVRVPYAVDQVIAAIDGAPRGAQRPVAGRHPASDYILSHYRGERRPWWAGGTDGLESAAIP